MGQLGDYFLQPALTTPSEIWVGFNLTSEPVSWDIDFPRFYNIVLEIYIIDVRSEQMSI